LTFGILRISSFKDRKRGSELDFIILLPKFGLFILVNEFYYFSFYSLIVSSGFIEADNLLVD
jgi:hypothetical protein